MALITNWPLVVRTVGQRRFVSATFDAGKGEVLGHAAEVGVGFEAEGSGVAELAAGHLRLKVRGDTGQRHTHTSYVVYANAHSRINSLYHFSLFENICLSYKTSFPNFWVGC
jgi:hypothetical protein